MPHSKIYFVGACNDEKRRLQELLSEEKPEFFSHLDKVPADAVVLSVSIGERVTRPFLESHPLLKLIATRTTGCDHIDTVACKEKKIAVKTVEEYGENTVAEHTFALLLALTRNLRTCYHAVQSGKLVCQDLRGSDLFGKTLGVIGCGRVGLHVIRIAQGFRMKVLGCDTRPHPFQTELLNFSYTDLQTLLSESDIISLHLPLNKATRHFLDKKNLALCKPGVLIINTARGALLDMESVMEGLNDGRIGGLGLDVLEDESVFAGGATSILSRQIAERVRVSSESKSGKNPSRVDEIRTVVRDHRVMQHPRVVFTPHTAYLSVESMERICSLTAKNILSFLKKTESFPQANEG